MEIGGKKKDTLIGKNTKNNGRNGKQGEKDGEKKEKMVGHREDRRTLKNEEKQNFKDESLLKSSKKGPNDTIVRPTEGEGGGTVGSLGFTGFIM